MTVHGRRSIKEYKLKSRFQFSMKAVQQLSHCPRERELPDSRSTMAKAILEENLTLGSGEVRSEEALFV